MMANTPAIASTDVGSYLPKAGVEDFVLFVPDKQKTPAIRAGTVDPSKPYSFALPPSWSERKVANIASGTVPAADYMWLSGLHTCAATAHMYMCMGVAHRLHCMECSSSAVVHIYRRASDLMPLLPCA